MRRSASFLTVLLWLLPAALYAQQLKSVPQAGFEHLVGKTWVAEGTGFSTTLSYRWIFPGVMVESVNEVRNAQGGIIARYHGAYVWDKGRSEIAFWTVAEGGEVHRGRAFWRDGALWHEAEVSGGQIASYASALIARDSILEYFADYSARAAADSLLKTKPLVYRAR